MQVSQSALGGRGQVLRLGRYNDGQLCTRPRIHMTWNTRQTQWPRDFPLRSIQMQSLGRGLS